MPKILGSITSVGKTIASVGSDIINSSVTKAAVAGVRYAASPLIDPMRYAAKSTVGRQLRNNTADLLSNLSPNVGGIITAVPGFRHDDDKYLVAHSPAAEARKLKQYSQSYDLNNYSKHIQEASDKVKESKSSLLCPSPDSSVDVLTFGEFGKLIERKSEHLLNAEQIISNLNTSISDCIQKDTLSEMEKKFLSLKREIDSNSENYSEPAQIIKVYKEIRDKAFKKLEDDKKASIENIRNLFAKRTAGEDISNFKKNLARSLGINPETPGMRDADKDAIEKKLNKHMDAVIAHVNESYAKTESSLKKAFEGTPAKKENDKEIPGVAGLNKKVEQLEKESCEAKLLRKIYRLENLEKQGYKLPGQNLSVQVGNGIQAVDPSVRRKCLKDITEDDLKRVDVDGAFYGKRKSDPHHTTISGTKLEYGKDGGGEINSVSMEIPGSWFSYHNTGEHRMLADYESMVKEVKSMQNDKDTLTIHFTHNTSIDELRNEMIIDSYRAARKNGILTKDIRMTVQGGDKEHTFIEKPITEIMQALGLSCPEIEADAKQAHEERENQRKSDLSKVKSRYADLKPVPNSASAGADADAGAGAAAGAGADADATTGLKI